VDRVLPGHADTGVQLQRLLRGAHGHGRRVGLGDGHRHVGVLTGGQGVGGGTGRGAEVDHLQPQLGEPVLEGLEAADGTVELLALLQIPNRLGQRPVGEPKLLGGEQPGTGAQGTAHGGFGRAEAPPWGSVEGDGAERPGEVEGHLRGDGHGGGIHGVQVAVVGRYEQHVGYGRVGDAGQLAGQGAVFQAYGPEAGPGTHMQSDSEHADRPPGGEPPEQFVVRAGQQGLRGHHRTGQIGHGRDRAPQLLQDDGGFAVRGTLAAPFLGHQQPGQAHLVGERLPQGEVVRRVRLGAGDHPRRIAVIREQIADRGAERLFLLRVEQIGLRRHRARSFHATSLSVRGSAGRPRTRSATMFSRTSLVPPSMLLPLARR
jgi:hypothetical protein